MKKTRIIGLVLFTLLFTGLIAPAFDQKLPLKGPENGYNFINTSTNTALRLKIVPPEQPLVAGTNCAIRVELHNTGREVEVIYLPALTMYPNFLPEKTTLGVTDEFGVPVTYGRGSAKDETLNYVVLLGGDYYGRTYNWTPLTSGTVTIKASYDNNQPGPNSNVSAWLGKLNANSSPLRIIKK